MNKVAKTNADKVQLFAESVERHFGIESDHFDSNHFDEVNKFIEDNHRYFYPPGDPDDYRFDIGNEHDVDAQTLINPIRPGGGLRGPDGQTHSCQSETSYPMMPKLGDF